MAVAIETAVARETRVLIVANRVQSEEDVEAIRSVLGETGRKGARGA